MAEALQEYVDSRGVTVRVDRDRGVLRGVKLIGLDSQNGRRYRDTALQKATSLYEEAKVNVNHPKEGPLTPRDYQDRLGVIRGVDFRKGEGLFGDLHFNPKHVLAEQLIWDAQHNPGNVGFSHNVLARLSQEDEVAIVEEISRVVSVDLVADPATTKGLFENFASTEAEAKSDNTSVCWDALSVELLEQHRPDLLVEVESDRVNALQAQLEESQLKQRIDQRRQQINELLRKHNLPIPNIEGSQAAHSIVSSAFLETLIIAP